MKQEDKELLNTFDKELLLKDLCARLPYGVKVLVDNKCWIDFNGSTPSKLTFDNSYRLLYVGTNLGYVKPYLFPLSSMTEEQKKEMHNYSTVILDNNIDSSSYEDRKIYCIALEIEWLNKNHFDYRGLIEKGLALDATSKNIY